MMEGTSRREFMLAAAGIATLGGAGTLGAVECFHAWAAHLAAAGAAATVGAEDDAETEATLAGQASDALLEAPVRTPADALAKVRYAMDRFEPADATQDAVVLDVLRQVASYLSAQGGHLL